jgi:hypothetical protein
MALTGYLSGTLVRIGSVTGLTTLYSLVGNSKRNFYLREYINPWTIDSGRKLSLSKVIIGFITIIGNQKGDEFG